MYASRRSSQLVLSAPAKLNLFLEVLGKRSDGFHEIETLMYPVDLYDTLYFSAAADNRLTLEVERAVGEDAAEPLPPAEHNLVIRALELLRADAGCERGAHVRLIKRIPLAAGMAGGSSDAAAALAAGNQGWQLGYSREQLAVLAARLGSDVPFFLHDGPAVCRGRGEQIAPSEPFCRLNIVVIKPREGLATAAVYKACRAAGRPQTSAALQQALAEGNLRAIGKRLHNRLQEAARELSPWIERLEREFARLDVVGHAMSGSGTSYFGVCRSARQARHVAGRLRSRGIGRVYVLCTCRQEIAN
jgi:4-diphosphocytidyl-2-C-methyl-D-erythritol kinase